MHVFCMKQVLAAAFWGVGRAQEHTPRLLPPFSLPSQEGGEGACFPATLSSACPPLLLLQLLVWHSSSYWKGGRLRKAHGLAVLHSSMSWRGGAKAMTSLLVYHGSRVQQAKCLCCAILLQDMEGWCATARLQLRDIPPPFGGVEHRKAMWLLDALLLQYTEEWGAHGWASCPCSLSPAPGAFTSLAPPLPLDPSFGLWRFNLPSRAVKGSILKCWSAAVQIILSWLDNGLAQ